MVMDIETARKVASLARLEMKEETLQKKTHHLTNILHMVEQLSELDTDNVEPLANVVDMEAKLREDVINDGDKQQDVLFNAPEETQGFYVVPKVVETAE